MTTEQFRRRYTTRTTDTMAIKCISCGYIDEVDSRSDGKRCAKCGGVAMSIGYLRPQNPKTGKKSPLAKMTEEEEQIALFRWADFAAGKYPELRTMYHIPNEGKRSKYIGARMKAAGLRSGVPDVCLPAVRGRYHGLYIELKTGRNTTTDNQASWLEALEKQGYYTTVCYGWQAASETITKYLEGQL